jgi:hypothetical protein
MAVDVSGLEAKYGIPDGLYSAIINAGEQSGQNAVSPKGAVGYAQLMPATARDLGVDPHDPAQNLDGGARYTAHLWNKYQDAALTAAAYNAGPGAVDKHGGVPPYPETKDYVQRVTGAMGNGQDETPPPDAAFTGGTVPKAGPAAVAPDEKPPADDAFTGGAFPTAGPAAVPGPAPGSGSVVFAGSSTPVNAAQEKTAQDLYQSGQFDPNAKPGQPGFVMGVQPGSQAPQGVAYIDQDGSFHPAPQGAITDPNPLLHGITTLSRSVPGFSELSAGMGTAVDAVRGALQGEQVTPQAIADTYAAERKRQDVGAQEFQAAHPIASDLVKGVGFAAPAALAVATGGASEVPAAATMARSGIGALATRTALGTAKNATLGAIYASTNALAQPGSLSQRLTGADNAILPGMALGVAVPAALGGAKIALRVGGAAKNALLQAAEPFSARFSQAAAERQAGNVIASNASDLPAVRASLANGPTEIVPGSVPTTFQQTQDTGLGTLERGVATKSRGAFGDVRAAQNAARVSALGNVQASADPVMVSKYLTSQLDQLDATHTAAVQAATDAAQGKAAAIGGTGTPEGYGADLRAALIDAEKASKARYGALSDAIDPSGKLTANVAATKGAAADILANEPATAAPVTGDEAGVFQAAQAMPDVAPARDLLALRKRVNNVASAEKRANGSTATYARLQRLKTAIDTNLATTVSDKIASDAQAVAAGQMAPDQAIGARIGAWQDDWQQWRQQADARTSGQASAGENAEVGTAAVPRVDGAGSSAAGGSSIAQGNPSLPSNADLTAARSDIEQWRSRPTGSLFGTVQRLGGIKLTDGRGTALAGPDIGPALRDVRVPGLVNNRNGLPPEQMAQALADRGFFGPNVADPSRTFEAALIQEARGNKVYAPPVGGESGAGAQIEHEVQDAGISAADRPDVAAQRLAAYRAARSSLLARARAIGIENPESMGLNDLAGDVQEREAIQAEGGGAAPAPDPHGAEFDRLSAAKGPTFDQAANDRLKAFNAAYAEHARTFGIQSVAQTLRTKGYAGDFLLPDGSVPGKHFVSGPAGFNTVSAAVKASPDALPILQDYAASSLKRAAGQNGTIDPAKFELWQKNHADALRALPPETQARFADAASAGQAVGDAAVTRAAAIKAAQTGAVGRVMGLSEPQDVTRTVRTILGGNTAVADMRALATAAKANPDAFAGLRQAVADHITGQFLGTADEATSGVAQLKGADLINYVKKNRAALGQVFTPTELNNLDAIAADIRRSNMSVKLPGGSNENAGEAREKSRTMLDILGASIGAGLGHHFGTMGSAVGSGAGVAVSEFTQQLRAQGIANVENLVTRAMTDPNVAKALLARVPEDAGKPVAGAMNSRMRTLLAALAGTRVGQPVHTAPSNALLHRTVPSRMALPTSNALMPR